jgi:hypothetical protein
LKGVFEVSELKVIYLGPACQEQSRSGGREWCQDDVWGACECGQESVRYVLASEFDRVTAERDALQQRLNEADQRIDELTSNHPAGSVCRGSAALGTACGKCDRCAALQIAASAKSSGEVKFKGMVETVCGTFAIMIDEANAHYGWTFKRHPDGMWVSGRKATDAEMQAARRQAQINRSLTGVHLYSTPQ